MGNGTGRGSGRGSWAGKAQPLGFHSKLVTDPTFAGLADHGFAHAKVGDDHADLLPRPYLATKLRFLHSGKNENGGTIGVGSHTYTCASALRQGFDEDYTGDDRISGKVPREEKLRLLEAFVSNDFVFLGLFYPINEQKGFPMREQRLNVGHGMHSSTAVARCKAQSVLELTGQQADDNFRLIL